MRFLRKCFILIILVSVCSALYAWAPNLGHINIVFLKYNVYIDIYILLGILCILFFFRNITVSFYKWVKKYFGFEKITVSKKAINDLAKAIVLNSSDCNLDRNLDICKQAMLVRNGLPIAHCTGVVEVDIYNRKSELNSTVVLNDINYAVKLATQTIREFSSHVFVVQDEILRIAVRARLAGMHFDFDPTQSKYKLSPKFISTYNVKIGLADVSVTTDVGLKLKILEKLHKKYFNDIEVSEQLLHTLSSTNNNKNEILELISEVFKIRPNRRLATDFLKSYTGADSLEMALNLLKSVPDDNNEKIWFLLTVAVHIRNYPQIIEYIRILKNSSENYNELCTFYIENYATLSTESEIISLLCK